MLSYVALVSAFTQKIIICIRSLLAGIMSRSAVVMQAIRAFSCRGKRLFSLKMAGKAIVEYFSFNAESIAFR